MLLTILDFLIRKTNLIPDYVLDRIWFVDRRYNLNGSDYKPFTVKVGKAGFYVSAKSSVIGFYFQPIPF